MSLSIFLCFILNLRAISEYKPPGACFIGGFYFRNFTVLYQYIVPQIVYSNWINNQVLNYWGKKGRAWKDRNHTFQSPLPLNLFEFGFSISLSIMFDATSSLAKFLKSLFFFYAELVAEQIKMHNVLETKQVCSLERVTIKLEFL